MSGPPSAAGAGMNVKFNPEWQDALLVGKARELALEALRVQNVERRGRLMAWEHVRAFANTALPMASVEFLREFAAAVHAAARRDYRNHELWAATSLELGRQGRLGRESLPYSIEHPERLKRLGVEEMQ